jgi:cobalt/nickel transport system permease protein
VAAVLAALALGLVLYFAPSKRAQLSKLAFPGLTAAGILAIQSYTFGSTRCGTLIFPIYLEGVKSGLLIVCRVLASVSILLALIQVTTSAQLIEALAWFRVPVEMREILLLMVRYLEVLVKETKRMLNAQQSRLGYSAKLGWMTKLKNLSMIAGMLIVRAYDRSDKVFMSMKARGYAKAGNMAGGFERFNRRDYVFAMISVLLIAGVVLIGAL